MVDFTVPADHRVKLNENENKDKFPDLAKEMKKLWNMKVTVILIIVSALGTVTKELIQELEDLETIGRVETIQFTILLKSDRILWRSLKNWVDLLSLELQ